MQWFEYFKGPITSFKGSFKGTYKGSIRALGFNWGVRVQVPG